MFWYILLFIAFALLFVTVYYGIKMRSNFLFFLYLAKKRTGKSTDICKKCLKYLKKGYDVYVNSDDIRINGVRHYNTQDLGKFDVKKAVIFIDEISIFYDNRQWKNTSADFISWLRGIGHDRLIVYAYSQTYDVDVKARKLADGIFIMRKYFNCITISRKLQKNIAIKDSAMNAESQIVDEIKFIPFFLPAATEILWLPKYIKYFDSFKDLQKGRSWMRYDVTVDGVTAPGSRNAVIKSFALPPMQLSTLLIMDVLDQHFSPTPTPITAPQAYSSPTD